MKNLKTIFSVVLALLLIASSTVGFAAASPEIDGATATYANGNFEGLTDGTLDEATGIRTYAMTKQVGTSGLFSNQAPTIIKADKDGNHYIGCETGNIQQGWVPQIGKASTSLVAKFKARSNTTDTAFQFVLRTQQTSRIEIKPVSLASGKIYDMNNVDTGKTFSLNTWHSFVVEYLSELQADNTYLKSYNLYYDGTFVGNFVDTKSVTTNNTIVSSGIWISKISATAATLDLDDIQVYEGTYDKADSIVFGNNATFNTAGALMLDKGITVAAAKSTINANLLYGGVASKIYTDSTKTTEMEDAAYITDNSVVQVQSKDGTFVKEYALCSTYFENGFEGASDMAYLYTLGGTTSGIPVYEVSSDAAKAITGNYLTVTGTEIKDSQYPRFVPKGIYPIYGNFVAEASVYVSDTNTNIDVFAIRFSNATKNEFSLGRGSNALNGCTPYSWNKIAVAVENTGTSVIGKLYVNGIYQTELSAVATGTDAVYCNEIRICNHAELGNDYNEAWDNIRIYKGGYDATNDVIQVNALENASVKENTIYTILGQSAADFGAAFGGASYVKAENLTEDNKLQDGSVVTVKSVSGDFWKQYTIADENFKVISFTKNAEGTKAEVVLNHHTTEPVLLLGVSYLDGELVEVVPVAVEANEDTASVTISLTSGSSSKFMLIDNYASLKPYCETAK